MARGAETTCVPGAESRGATGGPAEPCQLGDRPAGFAGERARQALQPCGRTRRCPKPRDARGTAGALQLFGGSTGFANLAQPEIACGALQRIEQPAPLRELAGNVDLRLLFGETVGLRAGAERLEEAGLVLDFGADPLHQERRIELGGHQRGLYWTSWVAVWSAWISICASRSPRRSCQMRTMCRPDGTPPIL